MSMGIIKSNILRLVLVAVLAAGIAVFFLLGGYRAFTFEHLVANKDALIRLAEAQAPAVRVFFITAYLILGLFGLPGSTVLNLTAGLLFDFWEGLFLVILASTLASSLAFFSFRYLFRSFVEAKVRSRFPALEEGLQRGSAYFVFAMRLFPIIPYSFTNLVLAVSPVPFRIYLWVTLLAMLPRYLLYVYAGTHLGDIQNPDDLISPSLIGALALLAVLPWGLKWAGLRIKSRYAKKKEDGLASLH